MSFFSQFARPHRWIARVSIAVLCACGTDSVFAQPPSEATEYYGLDAIGSVRVVFDPAGNVLARLDYEPFGRELSSSANAPNRKFAALFRDGEAGLDYAEARSYQVRTGRFGAPDPVVAGLPEPQRWNRYAYALNNASVFTDPSGMLAEGPKATCYHSGFFNERRSFCEMWLQMQFGGGGGRGRSPAEAPETGRGRSRQPPPTDNPPADNPPNNPEAPQKPSCDPRIPGDCDPSKATAWVKGFFEGVSGTLSALFTDGPESCLLMFAQATIDSLNPISPSPAELAVPIAGAGAAIEYNRALRYAASRPNYMGGQGLMFPYKSQTFRTMMNRSRTIGSRSLVLAEGIAMGQGLFTEWNAASSGACR